MYAAANQWSFNRTVCEHHATGRPVQHQNYHLLFRTLNWQEVRKFKKGRYSLIQCFDWFELSLNYFSCRHRWIPFSQLEPGDVISL